LKISKISYLTDFSLADYLTEYLMPSDERNSTNAKAMGLISSLFNVTLSQEVPFRQLQQLQCLHHCFTSVLHSFLHYRIGDDLR